jgi:hypothetical protein
MSPLPGEVWLAGLGLAVRARVARDPKFRKELLREGIEALLTGDIATAKTILRDYQRDCRVCRTRGGHAHPIQKPDAHAGAIG